jgi:disulfide bond formation protein DsbB
MSSDALARAAPPARQRLVPALIALFSAIALATAYVAQYGFGLEPCALCLWQRYPYWATLAIGVLGTAAGPMPWLRKASAVLAALAFLAGAGIAGFHVGVEQGWWEGLPGCSGQVVREGMTVAELQQALEARTEVVPCDEPAFTLAGISMAGYNLIASAALAVGTAAALRRRLV